MQTLYVEMLEERQLLAGVVLGGSSIQNNLQQSPLPVAECEGHIVESQAAIQPTASDANRDGEFDQRDIIQLLANSKYRTNEPASWEEGDWNNDSLFDEADIVFALEQDFYLNKLSSDSRVQEFDGASSKSLDCGAVRSVDPQEMPIELPSQDNVDAAVPLIVIDAEENIGVSLLGRWTTNAKVRGQLGNSFLHDGNVGKGASQVTFSPQISEVATYEVLLRWTEGPNRATNANVSIRHADGTTTTTVNQRHNGGQ